MMKANETIYLSHSANMLEFLRAVWLGIQQHWQLCRSISVSQWDVEQK